MKSVEIWQRAHSYESWNWNEKSRQSRWLLLFCCCHNYFWIVHRLDHAIAHKICVCSRNEFSIQIKKLIKVIRKRWNERNENKSKSTYRMFMAGAEQEKKWYPGERIVAQIKSACFDIQISSVGHVNHAGLQRPLLRWQVRVIVCR